MPYTIPTLEALRAQALQDIAAGDVAGVDSLLRRSVLRVLSWVMAGFAYGHYGYQAYIARQATPWGAKDEAAVGWGSLKGVTRKGAAFAGGTGVITGCVAGKVAPAGTVVTLANEQRYLSSAEAVVAGDGTLSIPFTAETAGAAGNADAGVTIYLVSPIDGIPSNGTAPGGISGGADQESLADFRARYLAVYAAAPQGGAVADYQKWALEVAGVTRAWVLPNGAGAGSVVVYSMLDEARASDGGFPQGTDGVASDEPRGDPATGDQLLVADHISPLRPATALVYSVAPQAYAVDFTLDDLSPADTATQAAIATALEDMMLRLGNATGGTLYQSDWTDAIKSVSGVRRFTVTAPAAPVSYPVGRLPTLGTFSAAT